MKLALLSDIHGNAAALEAVLSDLSRESVDQIICLGDVVSAGPQPREVLRRLVELGIPLAMGNTDYRVLHPISSDGLDDHLRMLVEIEAWLRQQVPADELAHLGNALQTLSVQLDDDSRLLCCHGSPRNLSERLVAELTDDELGQVLADQSFDLLAAGHTHLRLLREYQGRLLINPGTVGAPTGRGPIADYALLEVTANGAQVSFRAVAYDIQPAIDQALSSGMPHAAWWAARWLER